MIGGEVGSNEHRRKRNAHASSSMVLVAGQSTVSDLPIVSTTHHLATIQGQTIETGCALLAVASRTDPLILLT